MAKQNGKELFFTFKDFKTLYKKNKASYYKITFSCFILVFIWATARAPSFKSEATFKETPQSQEVVSPLKSLLGTLPFSNASSHVIATMKSRDFLREIISELGMQVLVKEQGFLSEKLGNVCFNILGEMKKNTASKRGFVFKNVAYSGDTAFHFRLRAKEDGFLEVLDRKGLVLAESRVGNLVSCGPISFVVQAISDKIELNRTYSAVIFPWEDVVKRVQKHFQIKEDKDEGEVLDLVFISKDQYLSADFLNCMMKRYTEYVKKEKEDLTKEHLAFFEERKKELEEGYSHFLQDHVAYLEKNLEKEGFLGLKQEMEVLEKPNEDYHTKLYEVELELNRLRPNLSQSQNNSKISKEASSGKILDKDLEKKAKKFSANKREAQEDSSLQLQERLSAILCKKLRDKEQLKSEVMAFANSFLKEDIQFLTKHKEEIFTLLQALEKKGTLTSSAHLQFSPDSLLANWIEELQAEEKKLLTVSLEEKAALSRRIDETKGGLKDFLNVFLLAIEKKQNAILDREIEEGFSSIELEGLNPETAQQLYVEYNHELDSVKLNIKQLIYLKEQIYDPSVELSSLCNLLTDPVSQQMIQKASQMSLELKDDFTRSHKEHERLKDSLSTQKNFLKHHITQMIELQRMRARLIEEKILSLQQSSVNLLCTEKQLIQDRLSELRKKMSSSLPKKWMMENQLQLKKELYKSMIEGIAQLEESKRIDQNILPSGCKVIDQAIIPKKIQPPGLLLYPVLLSFILAASKYVYDFAQRAAKGSPISSDLLKHYDFHTCGSISCYCDAPLGEIKGQDLETLRRISHFAHLQKVSSGGLSLALLGDSQSNYSHNLAKILALRGSKVLLIDSTFHGISPGHSVRGLLSYLQGEIDIPAIHHLGSYDFVYSGGYTRNFVDLLAHKKFESFILDRKKDYDFVVIHSQASSTSLEATIYQSLSDVCVIAAGFEDSLEDLENFIEWKACKQRDCLTFILRES